MISWPNWICRERLLDEYREFVAKLANRESSEQLSVRTSEHAAVVIGQLFATAQSHVRILSSALPTKTFGSREVIDSAIAYLRQGVDRSIDILLEQRVDAERHPLLRELAQQGLDDRVSLREVPNTISQTYRCNFVLADDVSFRFESERDTNRAFVIFRDPDLAANVKAMFNHIAAQSRAPEPGT